MGLRGTKEYKIFRDVFWTNNAAFGMILGICSMLAVTNKAMNAVVMGVAVTIVICTSSVIVSLIRNIVPRRIRLAVFMIIIATCVVFVDLFLRAYLPEMSTTLGAYVGLIITNCIVLGRAETFASGNNLWHSLVDAFGTGAGYSAALIVMALVREILGFGSIFDINILGEGWESWVVMIIAPGGFFVLGIFMWIMRAITKPWEAQK